MTERERGTLLDRLKQRYRVDEVPLVLRPALYTYGYLLGGLLRGYCDLVHLTSTIELVGAEQLAGSRNHIFCHWHEAAAVYPVVFPRLPTQAWLQHPSWYMLPSHVFLRLSAVREIILGSTGHSGRDAADALVRALRGGASTVMLPDGPYGPARTLRKGVLHISTQSGVPVVPIRFGLSSFVRLPGWDRKRVPLPFGKIRASYGEPLQVRAETLEADAVRLAAALSAEGSP